MTPGSDHNPLLDDDGLLRFDAVRPEHVAPAVEVLLGAARAAVAAATAPDRPATWDAVVAPLEDALERLGTAWSAVSHLNAVADTPALREQYNQCLPAITQFWTELGQNEALYARYRVLAEQVDAAALDPARRAVLAHELRDFRLGGAELPAAAKARLRAVRDRQALLATRFAENVLDATQAFALWIAPEEVDSRLAGVPSDVIDQYREAAQADGRDGCKLTLQYPSYMPALQYAEDRALRETLYRAYVTRAAEFGPPALDNTEPLLELLRLRREQAQLLGFATYGELSLATKMADRPAEVLDFLRDLARRSRPYAERDLAELREFAATRLGLPELAAWDLAFASERLREARYDYSEQEVKQYFPEHAVLDGLFRTIETLFAVRIVPDQAPVWHADVRFFRVASPTGEKIAQFYLDPYARDHKQGGAWQDDARSRRRAGARVQTPVSILVCNFPRPAGGRPALLTHDDVLTLFHEFGHGLHHMLTRIDEPSVSGIRGVEWDAVELPSQFMENFAWQWEVLQGLSRHVDSGAPLPRALFERMLAARNFHSGLQMLRQVEYALTDMLLHTHFDADRAGAAALAAQIDAVRREVAVVVPPDYHRSAHSFTHVFSGGYAAGYYSYKWAEVLSADAYAAFEEQGSVLDPALGRRFRDEVLAVGASRPAMDSFVAFRGRRPRLDALLRHSGLA